MLTSKLACSSIILQTIGFSFSYIIIQSNKMMRCLVRGCKYKRDFILNHHYSLVDIVSIFVLEKRKKSKKLDQIKFNNIIEYICCYNIDNIFF